jgi:hypothetical protein
LGQSFGLDARGKGCLAGVCEAIFDRGNPVLGHGQAVSLGGISCMSAKTDSTCTNAGRHGFSVAKATQRLY